MKASGQIIASIAIAASMVIGSLSTLLPRSAERDKDSVLVVDTTVEARPNPFMFFFGNKATSADTSLHSIIMHYHGTAFVIGGHFITAAHVVLPEIGEKVLRITITAHSGAVSEAKLLRSDKNSDLAELLPTTDLHAPTLELATRTPRVGDKVFEIGHPAMILYVVSRGEIVGFDTEQGYDIAAMDTFGGDSGGPVIDSRGKVIGVCHTLIRGSRFTGIGTLAALSAFLYPNAVR